MLLINRYYLTFDIYPRSSRARYRPSTSSGFNGISWTYYQSWCVRSNALQQNFQADGSQEKLSVQSFQQDLDNDTDADGEVLDHQVLLPRLLRF